MKTSKSCVILKRKTIPRYALINPEVNAFYAASRPTQVIVPRVRPFCGPMDTDEQNGIWKTKFEDIINEGGSPPAGHGPRAALTGFS